MASGFLNTHGRTMLTVWDTSTVDDSLVNGYGPLAASWIMIIL